MTGTAVEAEIAKFDALAARWWDPDGPMKPLHRMNPLRTGWIAERIARAAWPRPGARTLHGPDACSMSAAAPGWPPRPSPGGRDASPGSTPPGRRWRPPAPMPRPAGSTIAYREGTPEDLAAEGATFDAVVALEVIEHVADRARLPRRAWRALAKPGGLVFLSTLNRTPRVLPDGEAGRGIPAAAAAGRHA